jgi:uncharacterized integral membrane protein
MGVTMTHEFDTIEEPQGDGGLSARQKINLMATAALTVALAIFVVQNTDGQDVNWLMFDVNLPMWLIVLGSALVGMVLSVVGQTMWRRRRAKKAAS